MNRPQPLPAGRKWARSLLPLAGAMGVVLSCSLLTSPPGAPTARPLPTATNAPTEAKKPTPNKAATQEVRQQETAEAGTNFAGEVLTSVSNSLDAVGETMGNGSVVFWNPNPIPVESSKPNVISPYLLNQSIRGADFAFHSSITWETKQKVGIVYCVMIFRLKGDWTFNPWYMMRMGRVSGSGHIYFDVMQGLNILGESAESVSNAIRDGNGDTNDVLLIARANQFTVYVNGRQAAVWWNTKIDQGTFGFGTLQDTGTSVCTFADSWIYDFS